MRVLQLVQQAQMRGAELDALQLGDELERRGLQVHTAYIYDTGQAPPTALARARDIHLGGRYGSCLERVPGWHPGVLRRLVGVIDTYRPDIVQAGGGRTVKYGALACRRRARCRLVWRNIGEIDRWLHGGMRRAFYQAMVLPRVDAVVSMTSAGVDALQRLLSTGVPLSAVPPGIDRARLQSRRPRDEIRRSIGTASESPVALLIGALSPEKRVDVALDALSVARETVADLVLWIAGDGPLRGELEAYAEKRGVGGATSFLGARDDIGDLLSASDLLVVSSDTEGLPRVVLEAALAGVPVAATAVGGIPDVISHERTGLLAPPGDALAIAANIVSLVTRREHARSLSALAARWATRHATVEAVADRYQELYERLVGDRGRPSNSSPKPITSLTGSRNSNQATSP